MKKIEKKIVKKGPGPDSMKYSKYIFCSRDACQRHTDICQFKCPHLSDCQDYKIYVSGKSHGDLLKEKDERETDNIQS